jgi:signal transduction histidine kinase
VFAAIFFLLVVVSIPFPIVVLRAEPRRWDNRVFAAMALGDATLSAYRGLAVMSGHSLVELDVVANNTRAAFVMAWLSIEFAYSFPFSRPAPARIRVPTVIAVGAMLGLSAIPATKLFAITSWSYLLILPAFVVMVALLARNLRRANDDRIAIIMVMGALVFRWFSPIVTWGLVRRLWPEGLPAFSFFDATAAVLLSYGLTAAGVIRGQLLSVRGVVAEVVAYVSGAVGVVIVTAIAVEAALRAGGSRTEMRVWLVLAALVPVGATGLVILARGRIRSALLWALDPEGVKREAAVIRAADARDPTPEAMLSRVVAAITEITGACPTRRRETTGVRYLRARGPLAGPTLPPALADHLRASSAPYVHRALTYDLPATLRNEFDADVLVPVRSGANLFGALAITGPINRDTLVAASALANRLALKVENFELFAELETSRRLATLGAFAAAIAHDIRTPLTSVKMNVQILRGKVTLPAEDMEHFAIALEELDRLSASISQLLEYAKPIQVQRAAVDLRDVVEGASRAVQPQLSGRGLKVDQRHDARLPAVVGDAQRLRQVIVNLLENAANASEPGDAITIATRAAGEGAVAIDVIDQGKGIDATDLDHIFEPFFTRRADGTGLGLAICQKVVRAHAGEIRVQSSPGAGSTFTVLLPREVAVSHESLPT